MVLPLKNASMLAPVQRRYWKASAATAGYDRADVLDAIVPPGLRPSDSFPVLKPFGSQLTAMVTFVVVTGILYFGRDVLIPLALSVLLSFLLAPAVRYLERRKVPRAAATAVMVTGSCCVMAGIIWLSVAQFLNFAASLPEYK